MDGKQKIIETSFSLFLKYGIKSVSMDDIAQNIGISKKTIYKHFENKEDLVRHILVNHIEQDESAISAIRKSSENAIDEIVIIGRHVLRFLRGVSPTILFDLKKYYSSLWNKYENMHFSYIRMVIHENIIRGQEEGYYHRDIDPEIVSKLYLRLSRSIADETDFPLELYDRDVLFQSLITYHIRALLSSDGREIAQEIKFELE